MPTAKRSSPPAEPALADSLGGDANLVLPEFDAPPADPIPLARRWIAGAIERGVREPLAAALATVDADGRPSNRFLLLKDLDPNGAVFYGQQASRKGRDLIASPFASIALYWRETIQQLRIDGPVERLDDDAADALFASRLRVAQAAAAAAAQSRPLDDEQALRDRFATAVAGDDPVPRPAGWVAWRLVPETIEFWHGSPDRLHRRLRYVRGRGRSGWDAARLQP